MMKIKCLCMVLAMLLFVFALPAQDEKVEKERSEFVNLIKQNPNYFGTATVSKFQPVKLFKLNTAYEEICNLGYNPATSTVSAVVKIKKSYGYSGTLCTPGSIEYVRFFVDWNGNNSFADPGESVGVTSVNVHDIPTADKTCLEILKPISYAVSLKLDPKLKKCNSPYLVKVRAILSWNHEPTVDNPDYPPVWGNVVDGWIQIQPFLFITMKPDITTWAELYKPDFQLITQMKEFYKPYDIPMQRIEYKAAYDMAYQLKEKPDLKKKFIKAKDLSAYVPVAELILSMEYNTSFEELTCVGLDTAFDLETLRATIHIKKRYGYMGDLCSKGSKEYVGFWAYVKDSPKAMCQWKYLGTADVKVHDIPSIPDEGLQYMVKLPYDFSAYRSTCEYPKLIKIRARLSWDVPPDPKKPDAISHWGNKIDTLVQIKPGKTGGTLVQIPSIRLIGGVAVDCISGNSQTLTPSTIGDGYANIGSLVYESPFGGWISIGGRILNAPDYLVGGTPDPSKKLRYKIQYRKYDAASPTGRWQDITNNFNVHISYWDGIIPKMKVQPVINDGGYFTYEDNPSAQWLVESSDRCGGCIVADWLTPVADGDGLYEIRMLMKKTGAPASLDVPANHVASDIIKIMIDNTPPAGLLSLDEGNCMHLRLDTSTVTTTGRFTATDTHFLQYSLHLEPTDGVEEPLISPSYESISTVPAPGRTDMPFTLTAPSTTSPCGYAIHLYIWDRTIVNNARVGNQYGTHVGLCVVNANSQ